MVYSTEQYIAHSTITVHMICTQHYGTILYNTTQYIIQRKVIFHKN